MHRSLRADFGGTDSVIGGSFGATCLRWYGVEELRCHLPRHLYTRGGNDSLLRRRTKKHHLPQSRKDDGTAWEKHHRKFNHDATPPSTLDTTLCHFDGPIGVESRDAEPDVNGSMLRARQDSSVPDPGRLIGLPLLDLLGLRIGNVRVVDPHLPDGDDRISRPHPNSFIASRLPAAVQLIANRIIEADSRGVQNVISVIYG